MLISIVFIVSKTCDCFTTTNLIINHLFQPFTLHPKKKLVLLSIAFVWVFTIAVAVGPLLDNGNIEPYNLFVSRDVYFKNRRVIDTNALNAFALKLFTFQPGLHNSTESQISEVVNSRSWRFLTQFIQSKYSEKFKVEAFHG